MKRRKLVILTVAGIVVAFFAIRTEPARRVLAKSSMYVSAYNGMQRDIQNLRMWMRRGSDLATIQDYLGSHDVHKLQLGAGEAKTPGWLNSDIAPEEDAVYLDVTQPFPFEDGSFHYVFSEHLIEHIRYEDALGMLRETHRILAPGGKIRIATPNLLQLVALFGKEKTDEMRNYLEGKIEWHHWPHAPTPQCFILNYQLREFGHQFVYDPGTLRGALERVGFVSVREWRPGESDDPNLRDMEIRRGDALNNYETMVFEAVKP